MENHGGASAAQPLCLQLFFFFAWASILLSRTLEEKVPNRPEPAGSKHQDPGFNAFIHTLRCCLSVL